MGLPRAKVLLSESLIPLHLDDTQNYRQMSGLSVEG